MYLSKIRFNIILLHLVDLPSDQFTVSVHFMYVVV
jgi:hypothetical protein